MSNVPAKFVATAFERKGTPKRRHNDLPSVKSSDSRETAKDSFVFLKLLLRQTANAQILALSGRVNEVRAESKRLREFREELALDEALSNTFPASDPVSITPKNEEIVLEMRLSEPV